MPTTTVVPENETIIADVPGPASHLTATTSAAPTASASIPVTASSPRPSIAAPDPASTHGNTEGEAFHFLKRYGFLLLCGVFVLLFLAIAHHTAWSGAGLSVDPKTVLALLSPLLLTAGFIERAIEIIVSPWRDDGAAVLQSRLDSLRGKGQPQDPMAALALNDELAATQAALQRYKGETQRFAFGASIVMSFGAAVVGVRALNSFLPTTPALSDTQVLWFKTYDVALSAFLLAGGAAGLHSVINLFTTFFDTTTQKTQNSSSAPPKQG